MITFMDPKEKIKEGGNYLDSELWHACAGGMVHLPTMDAKVFYFVQGHAEHACEKLDFRNFPRIPPLILCRVESIKYLADPETDEVFARIGLIPVSSRELDFMDDYGGVDGRKGEENKPASFAKTLTQSDANNGGGFSVPRYCAETIFPRLDYNADPPVQNIVAKDVHGEPWKFRHIYRGTPRRHLLTTGWSSFVNAKKLVAGDSIVFLKADRGDLCVGIRRAKRGGVGGGMESLSGWNPNHPPYSGFSVYMREDDARLSRNGHGSGGNARMKGKVRGESVVEAASLAANGQPFEVMYYPRAGTPEFVVKAGQVKPALQAHWCTGMRFKMPFETEDSSRISWFMGTISAVQVADPMRWPDSPWRLLQVAWDEPNLLQNVKRVSPWLVELVSTMPAIHLSPFSPPRKKIRFPQLSDFPMDSQLAMSSLPGNFMGSKSTNHFICLPENSPAGMQGARHAQFGLSFPSHHHLSKHYSGHIPPSFPPHVPTSTLPSRPSVSAKPSSSDSLSCLLAIGNPTDTQRRSVKPKTHPFILFGKPILTEQQMSSIRSGDGAPPNQSGSSSPEGEAADKEALSNQNRETNDLELDPGYCKVFMDSEDVGRTLNLSSLNSYEELCAKLANMFGIQGSVMLNHVTCGDSIGSAKAIGDEPFNDFAKKAKRLKIMVNSHSSSDNTES